MKAFCLLPLVLAGLTISCTKSTNESTSRGTHRDSTGRLLGLRFSTIPIEAYCEARAGLECYRLNACRPTRLRSQYGDSSTCQTQVQRLCEGAFVEESSRYLANKGLIVYLPEQMREALEIHSRRHCNSNRLSPSVFAAIEANLTLGSECRRHEFCRSGYCTGGDGRSCGVCAAPPAPRPSACPTSCPLGEFCRCTENDAGRNCACKRALGPYEDCAADRNACDEGSRCINGRTESNERISACVPFPTAGEACGVSIGLSDCVGEQICDGEICIGPKLIEAGADCNLRDRLCLEGHDCRGTCVRKAGFDENCISRGAINIPDGGPPTCAEGICNGRCPGLAALGEFCIDASDCESEYGCYAGRGGASVCMTALSLHEELERMFVCP